MYSEPAPDSFRGTRSVSGGGQSRPLNGSGAGLRSDHEQTQIMLVQAADVAFAFGLLCTGLSAAR